MASEQKTLGATLSASLFVQTVGAIAPGREIYLPPPAQYVATWVAWGILGFIASVSERMARAAAQLSVLIVLTMIVVGPFGKKAVSFLNSIAGRYSANTGGPQ